jgi:hypothetical protein
MLALQGQDGVATTVDVLRQGARPQLCAKGGARAGPIPGIGLQFQEDVLSFRMFGPQLEGLFGQLQGHFAVTLGQLLLQQAAHADKARAVVLEKGLVSLGRALAVA